MSTLNLRLLKSTIDSACIEECSIPSNPWRVSTTIATMPIFHHEHSITTPTYFPTIATTNAHNPCRTKPCVHGICQISSNFYGYSCTCEYGYVGINCENILKQCELLAPCKNGGTCTDLPGSYKCDCPLGFTGKSCEKCKIN